MMYQRPARTREAPVPIPGYPRLQCRKKFSNNMLKEAYTGICNLDCIQGFRLTWDAHYQNALLSYCVTHDKVGDANETLKKIFMTAHGGGELYPGGTRACYNQQWFCEKMFRIMELLPCQFCGLRFLSENDRSDHKIGFHCAHGQ